MYCRRNAVGGYAFHMNFSGLIYCITLNLTKWYGLVCVKGVLVAHILLPLL